MPDHDDASDRAADTLDVHTLDDYRTAAGYDSLKFMRAYPALLPIEPVSAGRPDSYSQVRVAGSARELSEQSDIDLDLKVAYLGGEGGVASRLVDSLSFNETSVVVIANLSQVVSSLTISDAAEKIALSDDALDKLKSDLNAFHRKYGGYYCHTVNLGGEIYVAYQITLTSRTHAQTLRAKLEGKYKGAAMVDLMVGIQKDLKESAMAYQWRLAVQKIGAGGPLPDFDPKQPDEAGKKIIAYINDFIRDVEKDPKPYYGKYDGYWRFFDEAAPLRKEVFRIGRIVDELSAWASDYADVLATIGAFLDPDNREGYHLDPASRAELEKLRDEIVGVRKKLQAAYAEMQGFDDFVPPTRIDGVKDHPPHAYRDKVEGMRTRLLTQLFHGQKVVLHWPVSNLFLDKASLSMPAEGDAPRGSGDAPREDWPYLRMSHTGRQIYQLQPVDAKAGELLKHGQKVRIEQLEKGYVGQQLYMSDIWGKWYIQSATYVGAEHQKYEWIVEIEGCKDSKRVVTTGDRVRLSNAGKRKYFMFPKGEYLGVTDKDADDWRVTFRHAG
jgi:hypothetical protein